MSAKGGGDPEYAAKPGRNYCYFQANSAGDLLGTTALGGDFIGDGTVFEIIR